MLSRHLNYPHAITIFQKEMNASQKYNKKKVTCCTYIQTAYCVYKIQDMHTKTINNNNNNLVTYIFKLLSHAFFL